MKKILFMALAAATILSSCSKESVDDGPVLEGKTLEFTLSVAKPSLSTRMSDHTVNTNVAAAVRKKISKVDIEFYNAAGSLISSVTLNNDQLTILRSDDQTEAEANRKPVTLKNIPAATSKVNVRLNGTSNTNINDLQISYLNMEYYGCNETTGAFEPKAITFKTAATSASNALYKVEVSVKPVMSRFELVNGLPTIQQEGATPENVYGKNETEATAEFNASTVAVAKRNALVAWRASKLISAAVGDAADIAYAADPDAALADPVHKTAFPTDYNPASSFTFNYVYTNSPYKSIEAIEGYYMNNIPLTKGGALVLNTNDGTGNWAADALERYNATTGSMKKMFDESKDADSKIIAYNLFPQTFAPAGYAPIVDQIKAKMPHFIMKVRVKDLADQESLKWITIRAFRESGADLIDKFEAGKVYVLNPSSLGLANYIKSLQSILDGVPGNPGGGGSVDPDPELEDKDLEVLVKILEWTEVTVIPEW